MEQIILIKQNEPTVAALFEVEGEILNIVVKQKERFSVGDQVICLTQDRRQFKAWVLKKTEFNLYLYADMDNRQLDTRRRFPRYRCDLKATVRIPPDKKVSVLDISLKGFGIYSEVKLITAATYPFYIELPTGDELKVKIEVRTEESMANGFRYGTEIILYDKEDIYALRKYLLQLQLSEN